MRLHASLGALAGIARLASAAAVPRNVDTNTDTTCTSTTTEQGTIFVFPTSTPTGLLGSVTVLTVTLASAGSGSPSGSSGLLSGSDSSTCTTSGTPIIGQGSSGTAALHTVTVTQLPPTLTSTVTVPVLTVTVPRPSSVSPALEGTVTVPIGNTNSAISFVTVTVPESSGIPGSGATLTIPIVPEAQTSGLTVTVPAVSANAGSVVTVTIPEGPNNTATVVLTVTIPDSGSPGSWSTVITAPGVPGATAGPVVTVTLFTSSAPTTMMPIPIPSSEAAASESDWFPSTIETITIPLSSPDQASDGGFPSTSGSPLTVTYTLFPEPGLSSTFIGTITITPAPYPPLGTSETPGTGVATSAATITLTEETVPSGSGVGSPAGSSPLIGASGSSPTSSPSVQLVTYTVPPIGTSPGYTGVFTLTPGSLQSAAASSVSAHQPGVLTITEPVATVSVFPVTISGSGSLGQGNQPTTITVPAATVSVPASNEQSGSGVSTLSGQQTIVTVTIPQATPGTGFGGQVETLTLTIPLPTSPGLSSATQTGASPSSNNGAPGVVTITVPEATTLAQSSAGQESPSASDTIDYPGVVTVTVLESTSSGASPVPGTQTSGSLGTETASIVLVTYTVPAESGASPSVYTVTYTEQASPLDSGAPTTITVDSYGSQLSPPASNTTPNEPSQLQTVETITIGGPGSVGATASGPAPVTITLSPGRGSGSPVIIVYTPSATESVQQSSIVKTITGEGPGSSSLAPGGPSPVTITIGPSNGLGTPTVITYTPTDSSSPVQQQTVETFTVAASDTVFPGTLLPLTLTISPTGTEGTPVVITYTPTVELSSPSTLATGSAASNAGSVLTVTVGALTSSVSPVQTPAGSGYGASSSPSANVVTITLPSGSPIVVTIPQGSGLGATSSSPPDVFTITESLSPVPTGSGGLSGSAPGATILTVTPPSGPPVVVTLSGGSSASVSPLNQLTFTTTTVGASPTSAHGSTSSIGVITVTVPSGPPLTVTLPVSTETVSANHPNVVTVTEGFSSLPTGGTSVVGSVVTITPSSGSPVVVTIPPESAGSPITESANTLSSVSGPQTILVSELTLTETLPIGSGQFTVVQLTTQVTFASTIDLSSPIVPSIPATPVTITYTLSSAYGEGSTVLTYTTDLPVATALPSAESITTLTLTAPTPGSDNSGTAAAATQSAQVLTITPSGPDGSPSGSVITATITPSSIFDPLTPSVLTIWPSASSSSCTLENEGSAAQSNTDAVATELSSGVASEITIWPLVPSTDSSCTTLSTSYLSSTTASLFDPNASDQFSVITITPILSGAPQPGTVPSDTCTESSQTGVTGVSSSPITSSVPVIASVSQSTSTPESITPSVAQPTPSSPVSSTEEPTNVFPPPQTEFHRARANSQATGPIVITVLVSRSSVGGYVFTSPDGYGNPIPGYGTHVPSAISSPSASLTQASPLTTLSPLPSILNFTLPAHSSIGVQTSLAASILSSALGQNATVSAQPATTISSAAPISESATSGFSILGNATSTLASTFPASLATSLLATPIPASSTVLSAPVSISSGNDTGLTSSSGASLAPEATPTSSGSLNGTSPPLTTEVPPTATPITASTSLNLTAIPSPTVSNTTASPAPTSAQPPSASCGASGDRGEVVFNFDDIPTLSLGNSTDIPPQPVPFPYHRFFFSSGFRVVPPPAAQYTPSSGTQMVQYNTSDSATAQVGLAQLRENPCFRFDFLGVSLGCNSTDQPCVFNVTGLQWNGVDEVVQANRTFEIAACPQSSNCTLSHQILDSAAALTFSNLTSINITLTVAGQPQMWWGDDLQIAWTNNDCTAASCRALVPNSIMFPDNSRAIRNKPSGFLRWSARRRHNNRY